MSLWEKMQNSSDAENARLENDFYINKDGSL